MDATCRALWRYDTGTTVMRDTCDEAVVWLNVFLPSQQVYPLVKHTEKR
jgi:hypothetical protein